MVKDVEVKYEHIAEGRPRELDRCPVAYAVRDAFPGLCRVYVVGHIVGVMLSSGNCETAYLEDEVCDFIERFDETYDDVIDGVVAGPEYYARRGLTPFRFRFDSQRSKGPFFMRGAGEAWFRVHAQHVGTGDQVTLRVKARGWENAQTEAMRAAIEWVKECGVDIEHGDAIPVRLEIVDESHEDEVVVRFYFSPSNPPIDF